MEENQKTTQDKVKTLAQEAYTNLPPEMKCPICKQLMVDASLNPCCGQSFCDDCKFSLASYCSLVDRTDGCNFQNLYFISSKFFYSIMSEKTRHISSAHLDIIPIKRVPCALGIREKLLDDSICPECGDESSPGQLVSNKALRVTINKYKKDNQDQIAKLYSDCHIQ